MTALVSFQRVEPSLGVNWRLSNFPSSVKHWAVVRGHFGIVKTLVEKKADLHAQTPSGMTPLDEALVRGRLNVVKLLDENGVDVGPVSISCLMSALILLSR